MTGITGLLDMAAIEIRHTFPADELPVFGRHWTLRVTDDAVLIQIERATSKPPQKVNNHPGHRRPSTADPDPPPEAPPPPPPPPGGVR